MVIPFYLLQNFSALVEEVNVYCLLGHDTLWFSISFENEMCETEMCSTGVSYVVNSASSEGNALSLFLSATRRPIPTG